MGPILGTLEATGVARQRRETRLTRRLRVHQPLVEGIRPQGPQLPQVHWLRQDLIGNGG